jgi:hypothetical protein
MVVDDSLILEVYKGDRTGLGAALTVHAGSVEFQRKTKRLVDLVRAHTSDELAETFEGDRRRLLDENLRRGIVDDDRGSERPSCRQGSEW